MRQNPVVIIFHDSWDVSCGYVRAIARELSRNTKVVVHNPFIDYTWRQLLFDSGKRRAWLSPFYDPAVLYIPHLVILPFQRFNFVRRCNAALSFYIFSIVYAAIMGSKRPDMWFFTYETIMHPRLLSFARMRIYDRPDQFASLDAKEDNMLKTMDRRLVEASDVVVVNSYYSLRYVRKYSRRVVYAPWGLDESFLQVKPPPYASQDFSAIPHPRLGSIGTIDHRLDVPLLLHIAKAHPEWHVVLIGSIFEFSPKQSALVHFHSRIAQLRKLPNIHMLGEIDKKFIPSIIDALDLGLVLYDMNQEFVKGSNPIKMYEFIARGKPVISVPIEMARFLPLVRIARSETRFITLIASSLAHAKISTTQNRRKVFGRYTWRAHVASVMKLLVRQGIS